jgi:RNA polymerase sigma-70 factor (ECF subfamily)
MNKRQNPADSFLIIQYREGNPSVLAELVKRYHKVFCEKAYWITKDKEIAKDIAQESWIIIINKLHALENADSFKSWALRIVYTKAIDALKRRNKENKNLESTVIIESGTQSSEDESKLNQIALLKAIRKLSKEKQDIIRLFYAEEYSIIEISAFLKIPIGTVKSRLFKAREKLKLILKKVNHEK